MCSIPGLPTPGSSVRVLITRVNLNPLCVLVELWANFDQERKLVYQQLRREIQFPDENFQESHGSPGDLCLVKVFETWYRARVVSRNGPNYSVFLIDEGRTLSANTSTLAWGPSDFFHLPPEVEFCVLANILPLSAENRWSPTALEFLKSLCGKTVDGIVQDVLVPHRTFLLDMPSISKQMYEMGFAKKLSTERFKLYVSRSLQSFRGTADPADLMPPSLRKEPVETCSQNEKWQQFLYPELQTETVETVIITEVTNPLRIFCQLKVFSQELKKLTDQITQYYEGRSGMWKARPEHLGFPCAARGTDGKWYRSVLQQVFSSSTVVEVLHVDYGKKDFVPAENVRPLAAEFFRMPVVTYVCSLHGIIDKGVGWTAAQISYLKSLLLHRTLIAKFEYQSLSEGVHYVTLFGDENININTLFGKMERCLLQCEKSPGDFGLRERMVSSASQDSLGSEGVKSSVVPSSTLDQTRAIVAENLPVNSSQVVVVQHVNNPSEFWIQVQRYNNEFDQLMASISDLYDQSASTEGILKKLATGMSCVARSRDNVFYRAVIHEVSGKQAKVHMVDYGNTEVVDQCNLRVLPDQLRELPALALKCTLSGIKPKSGKWSHSAIIFFSKAVENKLLAVHVNSVSQDKHIVQLSDPSACGERNISKMLVSAGLAEVDLKTVSRVTEKSANLSSVPTPSIEKRETCGSPSLPTSLPNVSDARSVFREHLFLIGSSMEVNVSYIESLNDFWCQLAQNAGRLRLLMADIQNYYVGSKPQQPKEAACVARHPDNGMWYRALVIQKHVSQHVDVLFIDYGQSQKVPVQDLRPINPMFLKPKGQAFRCSLYNLIQPVNMSTFEWGSAAEAEFKNFVDSASTNMSLKCTIYAVMCDSRSVVFNVVDLETPFQSVCSMLVQKGLANRGLPKKVPLPPFRLDTYYYSTHEIKTGGEVAVKITSVKSISQFFCQLERNSKTIEELTEKVNYLCRQLQGTNCPKTFGTVCFAKYTDGYWYRGQIKSAGSTIQVYFVDYGDTLELDKADLLPIPIEAGEIMSVPVQAIECGLADLPEDVSGEVNNWFEKNVTEQSFTALVVAKEPNGKLIVELYDGTTQVNSKIKEKFSIETWRKESVSLRCHKYKKMQELLINCMHSVGKDRDQPNPKQAFEAKGKIYKCIPSVAESECHKQDFEAYWKPGVCTSESGNHNKIDGKKQENAKKCSSPGIQWKPMATLENPADQLEKQSLPSCREDQGDHQDVYGIITVPNKNKSFSKLSQLPEKSVKADQVSEVYVSHISSPSSFFVQLTEDEAEIYSIVDKLNGDLSCRTSVNVDELQEGDLVNAVFPDDGSWYRGVVQNVFRNGTVQVEFIDFGNTATVTSSSISRFDSEFLALPKLSIHCSLSGVSLSNKEHWDQEDVGNFRRIVGENGSKKLMCKFSKQLGSVWEVMLEDHGILIVELFQRLSVSVPDATPEGLQRLHSNCSHLGEHKDDISLMYKEPSISEGLSLEVYASSITGPHHFWCQYANTDELQRISEAAKEIGNAAVQMSIWAETLHPGSPCLALFAEDEQWYRAKVMKKAENALSVLFVDYGNESIVNFNKVKPVTPPLLETPPQAFLCQLDGFEPSQCSWADVALDQFACLITDRVLTVTIIKVKHVLDLETPPYHVRVECDGKVINDIMCNKKLFPHTDYLVTACSEQFSVTESTETCDSAIKPLFDGQEIVASNHKEPCVKAGFSTLDNLHSDLNVQKELCPVSESNKTAQQQLETSVRVSPVDESVTGGLISEDQVCYEYSTSSEMMGVNRKNEEPIKENHLESKVVKETSILAHTENDYLTQMDCGLEGTNHLEDEMSCLSSEILSSRQPDVPVNVEINEGLPKSENETKVSPDTVIADTVLMAVCTQVDAVVTNSFSSQASQILEEMNKFSLQRRENESDAEKMSLLDEATRHLSMEDEIMDLLGTPECEQPDGEIYEEVFHQCFDGTVDSSGARDAPLDNENSTFGTLKMSEDEPLTGTECIIWSYAHKTWCRAKIIKVFDDSVQVLLLDDDSHAIVDVQNIFKRIPEDLDQKPAAKTSLNSEFGIQQDGSEEHCVEPDGRISCSSDRQLVSTTEEVVSHRTPKLPGTSDLTKESFASPSDGQDDLPDSEVLLNKAKYHDDQHQS
ncbi:tudor domain-containing 6 isoform X2 [Scleropages formosus]|uniref:tudor domain-containing 6 isoform X2 n=1 Tax=Scleropages formosus TaxID=113540 RepID=UPI000877F661|nr:tudor domain-containing protein 6 isoform X2 [Scleropages formosus]